jgi:AraC-like DNA-binding protein
MAIYEKHTFQSPAIPFIFHPKNVRTRHEYSGGNWHENIEILSFTEGAGSVRIDGVEYPASVGDIFVINQNRLHEFSTDREMLYRVLIIDREFFIQNHVNVDELHFSTRFRDEDMHEAIEELCSTYTDGGADAWRELAIRAQVLKIITLLCKNHSELYDDNLAENEAILLAVKRAIGHIRAEYQRELSLDEISAQVSVSKYHFAREFHRITGYTIVGYVNLTRCEFAKTLLADSKKSMFQISEECGFSEQSYFARIFRKSVGMTPTEYRKMLCKEKRLAR